MYLNDYCDEGFFCFGGFWFKCFGDIGVFNYDSVISFVDSCYIVFECVCLVWNKIIGIIEMFN